MADEIKQKEPFDVYADQFTITITPFGANLSLAVREPHPSPSQPPKSQPLGTVRMSVEHLKMMIMIIRNQILQVERQYGIKAEVPRAILNQLQIPPEDWDNFWK